jgi:hypothetical protein
MAEPRLYKRLGCGHSPLGIMRTHANARLRTNARGRDGGIRKKLAAGIKLKDFAARSSRVPVAERFPASNMEN